MQPRRSRLPFHPSEEEANFPESTEWTLVLGPSSLFSIPSYHSKSGSFPIPKTRIPAALTVNCPRTSEKRLIGRCVTGLCRGRSTALDIPVLTPRRAVHLKI